MECTVSVKQFQLTKLIQQHDSFFSIRKAVTKGYCILSLYMGEIGVLLFLNLLAGCGTLNTRYLRKPCLLRKVILNFHALLAIRDAIPQLLF